MSLAFKIINKTRKSFATYFKTPSLTIKAISSPSTCYLRHFGLETFISFDKDHMTPGLSMSHKLPYNSTLSNYECHKVKPEEEICTELKKKKTLNTISLLTSR